MASVTGDVVELAERLRIVAEVLKRVPADHTLSSEERAALRKEVRAIVAQLLSAYNMARFADAGSTKVDPNGWRRRAEEIRALIEVTANDGAKESLLEIEKFYAGVAATQDIHSDTANRPVC